MIRFENESNGRFYYMTIERDLFDDIVIRIVRGGRGVSVCRLVYCGCEDIARDEIGRLSRIRQRNGYTLIE